MTNNHWSAYWETGALTSLPSDFKENYDGELAVYWQSILDSVESDSCLLDVCTGNGAVAVLISELADKMGKDISITAVDASEIKPQHVLHHFPNKQKYIDSVQFISGCRIENMADKLNQAYDLIVSQYGIEYCETKQAAKSIVHSLQSGGRFVFVSHSPDTAMLQYMRDEESIYQLFDDASLFEILKQFSKDKMTANTFKNKLGSGLQHLRQFSQYQSKSLYKTWGQNLYQLYQMNNSELKQQRPQILAFVMQFIYARMRSQDLLDVSEKLINDPQWYLPFVENGLVLDQQGTIKYHQQHNVGHYYEFSKP